MDVKYKFASLILDARLDRGLTQSEVSEAVGVSTRWYQKIESGSTLPGSVTLIRIVLFLHINVEELRKEVGLIVPVSSNTRKIIKSRR